MGILFRYELKKLFSRRTLWIGFALCMALQVLNNYSNIRLALGGAVDGMREVYARYDGQTITEALKARILVDYREYAAAHPEEFKPSIMEIGYWALDEQVWQRRHGYGVMLAYQGLFTSQTLEETQDAWQKASNELLAGVDSDGNPLSPSDRRWNVLLTARPPVAPAVRYDPGWVMGGDGPMLANTVLQRVGIQMIGYTPLSVLLVLLLLLSGLPGFAGERSARMEPVLLTGVRRRPAALAKLLAAMAAIAAAALALRLFELLLRAAAVGLDGLLLPEGPYGLGASHVAWWAATTLILALGCAAGVALITAVSAPARGAAAALGLAATVLAAQYGLRQLAQMACFGWQSPLEPWWITAMNTGTSALPLNVLDSQGAPFGILPSAVEMALLFAVPAALLALCLWLSPYLYLKRRKH